MIRARFVAAKLSASARPQLRSAAKLAPRVAGVRSLSASALVRSPESEGRAGSPQAAASELAAALRAEQKLESETAAEASEDAEEIKEWAKRNDFSIVETAGLEQVQLVRKVSDTETLRVFFSISDVVNAEGLLDETAPFEDENGNPVEDAEAENDGTETPVRVNIVVEKPNGALGIEGVVQDDLVLVESVIPYGSAELALEESASAEYNRRLAYQGPPFGVLDPSVQASVQQYLETRGLDGDFALFVQEYASFRENKEYIDWLGRIASIVA